MAIITVIVGMIQMRELEFVEDGDIELDNILLLIAQTGTYIYTSFTIIGGNFGSDVSTIEKVEMNFSVFIRSAHQVLERDSGMIEKSKQFSHCR